jgi:hypothetical protein
MKKNKNITLSDILSLVGNVMKKIGSYKVFIFFLIVATIYGYIIWRINAFSNAPASQSEISSHTTAQPRIDQSTIDKIKSLQDNSVGVKSLFIGRQNPFQE